jgi:hypothetical protein
MLTVQAVTTIEPNARSTRQHNEIVANRLLLRYTQRLGGLSMKKQFLLSLLLSATPFLTLVGQAVAADPGSRYADAFILIQQGDAAQKNADSGAALQKYNAAIQILRAIRADTPDWNPQMVDYRLKDVTARVEAANPKVPEAAAPSTAVETAAAASPSPTPAAVVAPSPPPPSAAPKTSPEVETLSKENKQLSEQLASSQREVADLQKQTKDLSAQLVTAQKQTAKPAAAAAPTESANIKALRADLDQARKTAARVPDLEKQNKDLSAQLAAAQKRATTSTIPVASGAGPKQNFGPAPHTEAIEADATNKLKEQVSDLQKQNKDLTTQLATAQKDASAKAATAAGESTELNKTHAELADARAQVDSAKKASARVAELEKSTKDLTAQLAAAQKQASAKAVVPLPATESPEYKKLRAHADDLEKQNKELSGKLAAAEKQASAKAATPAESAEINKLRTELSSWPEQRKPPRRGPLPLPSRKRPHRPRRPNHLMPVS